MTYPTMTETRGGITDPQTLDLWDFTIPGVPNARSSQGRDVSLACQSCEYPGRGNELVNVILHGYEFNYSGRATMPHTLSATYVEVYDMRITHLFMGWFEYQRGSESGLAQSYKTQYAVDGAPLIKYDYVGIAQSIVEYYGLQPDDLPNASLDGTSSGLYTVSMSFRYDFYRINLVRAL